MCANEKWEARYDKDTARYDKDTARYDKDTARYPLNWFYFMLFYVPSIFSLSSGDVTIASEGLQNLSICSAFLVLE